MTDLATALAESADAINGMLDRLLPLASGPERRLAEAMRHGVLGGGKRIRPFLVMQSAALCGAPREQGLRVAAAVECLHCYSLIHDDLPAMDDAALRRGQPAVHRQYGEAMAILAGDALQALAFEILANRATHPDARVRLGLVAQLAHAAGVGGMVTGQVLDIAAPERSASLADVIRLQRLKTGALIEFACLAGAVLTDAPAASRHALGAYAQDIGLAFQIADDLLDVEGSEAETGKSVGQDAAQRKATFISIMGPAKARTEAEALARRAAGHLDLFGDRAMLLKALAGYVVSRQA
ncbi:MAG: polyprenyl synthetase family protein [Dongiaceae bacterium]